MNILKQVFWCFSVGYTPESAASGHEFSFRRYHQTFLQEGISPVTFSYVFFTCDFHPPTLASLTENLTRTHLLGTAQLPLRRMQVPEKQEFPGILKSFFNLRKSSQNTIFPRGGKKQFGGNPMLFVIHIPMREELLHLKPFICFWFGESFIKSKAITEELLQKKWELDQTASAFHIHHSRSPRRSAGTEIGWNPVQSQ